MSEEIIINGVNVAGCPYRELRDAAYGKKHNHCNHFPNGCCSKNNNCYYKQLQRKEQECETLKAENEERLTKINKLAYILHNYKLCFEGAKGGTEQLLKLQNNEVSEYWARVILNYLNMRADVIKEVPDYYRQVLNEIKGLAQSINDEFENDDIEQQLHYAKEIAKQIEIIINEVLKDE